MTAHDVAIDLQGVAKSYSLESRPLRRLADQLLGRSASGHLHHALREVNLQVRRGESVGVIGRNGAGKSTLLQLICGVLQPTRGQCRVHGRVAALLELGAGFNPELTGRENVRLNGRCSVCRGAGRAAPAADRRVRRHRRVHRPAGAQLLERHVRAPGVFDGHQRRA
jgi:ABC-type polysaccharide/polyol phosphate transport system ATPase subunit